MEKIIDFDEYLDNPKSIQKSLQKSSRSPKTEPKRAKKEPKKSSYERCTDSFIAPQLRQKQSKKDKNTKLCECPDCKGAGRVNLTLTIFGPDKQKLSENKNSMICTYCRGYGTITLDEKLFIDNLWCECSKNGLETEAYYVDSYVDKFIKSHHWKCKTCGKVKQIG